MQRTVVPAMVMSFCIALAAQSAPDAHQASEMQSIVSAQFGPQFSLLADFPLLTGDFNGDGAEDAVFVATSRGGVQINSDRFHVMDPSSEYFGIGDPKITSQFGSPYPGGKRYLLIIHGSGKEGWRAKEPKGRFVLINISFDRLSIGHVTKKKKVFEDISVEETGVLTSFLYWNGHGYKWQPGGAEL